MTGKVLVVDDVAANVKLLEAKLTNEYYDVVVAYDGYEALEKIKAERPDIVLLDIMMPGMDGFEVCRRIKADVETAHIPVIMITALSEPSDRVRGLEFGADDFLTKPASDLALYARVRSLVRLKLMMDELRLREQTGNTFGVLPSTVENDVEVGPDARILIVDDCAADASHMQSVLSARYQVAVEPDSLEALVVARGGDYDLVIATLNHQSYDSLRLCSQLRSLKETRQVPLLCVAEETDNARLIKALDLGVNDYLIRPVDRNELLARALTQVRRKRYQDKLRQNYHLSLSMAVTDGLTGLYNRRYAVTHLDNLLEQARTEARPLSLILIDIDRFKVVNDRHGHPVGDEVLVEFSERLKRSIRGVDLVARFGGEEFVVVMPDTDTLIAMAVAERLRKSCAEKAFSVSSPHGRLDVTCSLGVASSDGSLDGSALLKSADEALYRAKNGGRNRVMSAGETLDGGSQRAAAR